MNYFVTSFLIHFAMLIALYYIGPAGGKPGAQVEVTLIEKDQKPYFPPTPRKPLKPGKPTEDGEKGPKPGDKVLPDAPRGEEVDLSDYASRLKVMVDPVWIKNAKQHFDKIFTLEVLINVNKSGIIINTKVIKSSGYFEVDQIALATFEEIGTFPTPPEVLVAEGIIWTLSTKPN